MSNIRIHLFGRFEIYVDEYPVVQFRCQKALELFCFLLLYRDKPHLREKLAETFWGSRCTAESKKYFRKTLWQLQSELENMFDRDLSGLINVEQDWIRMNMNGNLWLDVMEFEQLLTLVEGKQVHDFDTDCFEIAQKAEQRYRGDLLEGWYEDWCIYERERYKDIYFTLVNKLMAYCEAKSIYECGISYGRKLLDLDRAHETTYQRLIRLYTSSGDRTSALRMFEACRTSLRDEFNIEPSITTLNLYQHIKSGNYLPNVISEISTNNFTDYSRTNIRESIIQIKNIIYTQASAQDKILSELQAIEEILARQ